MRKSILLLSAFFFCNLLLSTFYSCDKNYTCTEKTRFTRDVVCYDLSNANAYIFTSSYSGKVDEGNFVKAENLNIKVTLVDTTYTCKANRTFNPFMTSAYACTPPPPRLVRNDQIVNVSIISDNNYDDSHKAGSDLSNYFDMPELSELNATGFTSTNNKELETSHLFILNKAPSMNMDHNFTIQYHLASGNMFEATTYTVKVTD